MSASASKKKRKQLDPQGLSFRELAEQKQAEKKKKTRNHVPVTTINAFPRFDQLNAWQVIIQIMQIPLAMSNHLYLVDTLFDLSSIFSPSIS